jgi:hypothetical protein
VAVVLGGAWIWWMVSARNWFTGPRQNVDPSAVPGQRAVADSSAPAETVE